MLFAVIFTDKPNAKAVRLAKLQAHIDWLERNKDVIPVGGSLRHEPGETPKGGLWIAEAESKAQLNDRSANGPVPHRGPTTRLRDPALVKGQCESQGLHLMPNPSLEWSANGRAPA